MRISSRRILWGFAALLLLTASAAIPAGAQGYPTRTVRMVVPYPAGGPTDAIARLLAQKLAEQLGGRFIVENIAGAGATLGAAAVANAAPDGYTVLVAVQDLVVQPIIKAKVPYDPFTSFVPVTLTVTAPEMIVVHPSLPAKDMKELIALLKANPGKYSYASPGYGSTPHLACERLFRLTHGIEVTHVPFQGGAPAVQSALAGHTPIFHNVVATVAPHVRQGTLRALAVASNKRSAFFPDVPTLTEAGIPGHDVAFWMGALLPAATPKNIVELLQQQIATALALPDVRERLTALGFDPAASTSEAFAAHMKAESDGWTKVVRDANIKIE